MGSGTAVHSALQPIVDLATGRVVGVEALARFPDKRSPELHFAEAETNGSRMALELAAVRAGLRHLRALPGGAYLTLNVSPKTAASPRLAHALAGAPAERIVLELTEHAPVEDYPALETALAKLRERGIRIAVDDAGAGFASMRHILALRPDVLKLDVSITHGINGDARRRELVRALVTFARATGCTLVAEGIETEDELHAVRALGVRCGQGFRLGRPERNAAGPWQVALPPMRRHPSRGRRPVVAARHARVAARMNRLVRPAGILLAAAIAWPGIVSVAGLKVPSPGARRVPAVESRSDDGGSTQTRSTVPGPAALQSLEHIVPATQIAPVVKRATVPEDPPAQSPTPSPRPMADAIDALDHTVGRVVDMTLDTVDGTVDTVEDLLTGVLSHRRSR